LNRPNVTVKLKDRTLRFSASYGPGKLPPFHNTDLIEAVKRVPGVEDAKSNLHFQTLFITFVPRSALQKKGMFNSFSAVFARFGYKLEN